jgi:hypothetical protein
VLGFYARKSRELGVCGGESGAFTVVQRSSSDLRLNPHYHVVFLDGVFAPDEEGKLEFHPLGSLSNGQLADLIQAVRIRVLGYLERQGAIESSPELVTVDELAKREPALAALAREREWARSRWTATAREAARSQCTANLASCSSPV